MPGPPPKRSEHRRRANTPKSQQTAALVKPEGAVDAPPLDLTDVHPMAAALFESIAGSPEAQFFTPAVWQRARVHTLLLSNLLRADRPSANMYAALQSDWQALLISPAEQRRLGIEVQRVVADDDEAAADATVLDLKAKLSGAG